MHDAPGVRCGQNVEHAVGDAKHLGRREAAAGGRTPGAQRLAFEQVHHEEGAPVGHLVVVEHPHDARVVHRVREASLAEKAPPCAFATRQSDAQNLDGDASPAAMVGLVDRRHAPSPEEPNDSPLLAEHLFDEIDVLFVPRHGAGSLVQSAGLGACA